MILIIDNYDSFTYNVYQYIASLGYVVEVVRNDQTTVEEIAAKNYSAIIISPGPGTPDDAGISKEVIAKFAGQVPILGICLGHQSIAEVFGGRVVRAPKPVHGKVSFVHHSGTGIYQGLPQPFVAGRYHSLLVEAESVPACLEVTSRTEDGLIMGLKHREYTVEGVQFHPESVLTPEGMKLFNNFLQNSTTYT
ncbi:aminodeoxychorismate/anthranilate synthase component II [Pelosinus sp. IPA-1]|uniref:anthranilate synthase component II n=1 Tax=Pelosinus sp. IPA-1 TaxID=3029569 RepID=UPI0024361B82|nr:aminodeoxychorismate/anthranilate synthase component II [Pelosinus sp. IPA-1]GMB00745.1 glutamine amidotransferase [Pelosinus sp. IPA-1]